LRFSEELKTVMRTLQILFALLLLNDGKEALPVKKVESDDLPKVVLIGDSIRMGYAPLVAERLKGKAVVVSHSVNGGDSANVLKNLGEWIIGEKPTLVHLNCGLHDLKLDKQLKKHQVELAPYEVNLKDIVTRIRKETNAALVFASTTPILDERHAKHGAHFDRFNADVERYNAVAQKVMRELGVTIHDLNWLVNKNNPAKMLLADGTHYTPEGNAILADAVADCALRQLSVMQYNFRPSTPSGREAAETYRKEEERRDALVPSAYKNLKVGKFEPPANADAWKSQRPDVLRKVVDSLGDLPPRPSPLKARVVSRELRSGFTLERVAIDNGVDNTISALLLIPEKLEKPAPAILWLHSSTPDKNQVITPNTNGGEESLGEEWVRKGYVVFAPDAYWHGDRAGTGPAGAAETKGEEHNSLFKLHLWMGWTLWGMFVRDDQMALDYLCSRPEVDGKHIGATGMSMGSTRAWWLAAVDERVTATVGMACLTRYQNLIAHGQLRQHGIYYFANGLLRHFDSEAVVALMSPRAALFLTGELDAGSPADGIKVIEQQVSKVYAAVGAAEKFRSVLYPEVGHTVTPTMRREMMAWFEKWLKPRE
jgi:dienelactone hydrolase/lysophospholipase L1-like esterase